LDDETYESNCALKGAIMGLFFFRESVLV